MQHSLAEAQWFHLKVRALAVSESTGDQRDNLLWICGLDGLPGAQDLLRLESTQPVSLQFSPGAPGPSGCGLHSLVGLPNLLVVYLTSISLILTESWFCSCSNVI